MPYHSNSRFQHNVYIGGPGAVLIGENCQINEHVFLQGALVGNNVMIAPNVAFVANVKDISRIDVPMNMQGWKERGLKVTVADDVWIGRNVIVMPGVKIGQGAVVGAGAVVTRDVLPYTVVGGVPAVLIRSRR